MREEVNKLIHLGPMPNKETVDLETVAVYENLINRIEPPLSINEAEALFKIFGPDSFYGLAWTLLNLIETTPELLSILNVVKSENVWVHLLRKRATSRMSADRTT